MASDYVIKKRAKRHDYFTSCLPWPQKGDAVSLPLGTRADIAFDGGVPSYLGVKDNTDTWRGLTQGNLRLEAQALPVSTNQQLYADLSDATAATINQLREAFQVQKLYERDARGGTRYTEIIKSHFGVTSPDARMQRPEYLGGNSTPLDRDWETFT